MKVTLQKLFTVLAAFCVLLAATVVSASAEGAHAPMAAPSGWTDQTNVSIRESFKTLTSEERNIAGGVTYSFTLTSVDDIPSTEASRWDSGENGYAGYPEAFTRQVTLPSTGYAADDGISAIELSTGPLFDQSNNVGETTPKTPFTFPHAGVYLYEVKESAYTYDTADNKATHPAAHGTDPAVYTMKIFVVNDDDEHATGAGALHITNIVVRNGAGEKVNYSSDNTEANGFHFTNKYYPESNGTLTLQKALERGAGEDAADIDESDRARAFEYTVTIQLSDTIAAETGFGLPETLSGLTDLTLRYLDDDTGNPVTLLSGKAAVSANAPITLTGLPVGATYSVEETDRDVGDDENTATQYYSEEKTVTGELSSENHNPTATITNKKMREIVPTGLPSPAAFGSVGAVCLLLLAFFLWVLRRDEA